MAELTLYGDASWQCPWGFHVMVALDELGLKYKLEPLKSPLSAEITQELQRHALLGKTPCLAHGDFWLTESGAISEYLAETFPPPAYPALFPTDIAERARARQVMSWLRTSLNGLRDDRPSSSVFLRPVTTPLSEKARQDAEELFRVAEELIPAGATQMFSTWSIADLDLAMMLMRLVANNDRVPARLADYAMAQWGRRSVRRYLAYIPTSH